MTREISSPLFIPNDLTPNPNLSYSFLSTSYNTLGPKSSKNQTSIMVPSMEGCNPLGYPCSVGPLGPWQSSLLSVVYSKIFGNRAGLTRPCVTRHKRHCNMEKLPELKAKLYLGPCRQNQHRYSNYDTSAILHPGPCRQHQHGCNSSDTSWLTKSLDAEAARLAAQVHRKSSGWQSKNHALDLFPRPP